MQNFQKHNAVSQRIDQLTLLWDSFIQKEKAKVCLWQIQSDERNLLEAFVDVECSQHGKTEEFFVRFETPFKNTTQYTKDLIKELKSLLDQTQAALEQEDIYIHWKPYKGKSVISPPSLFTENLQLFIQSIPTWGEGKMVAYLAPSKIDNENQFLHWIGQIIENEIPDKVRLMLLEDQNDVKFEDLLEVFPIEINAIEPQLDTDNMLRQLASMGSPKNPGVQFRQKYVAMTQAGKKGDLKLLNKLEKEALLLVKKQKWPQLEVFVHSLTGNILMGVKQFDQALKSFAKARKVAESGGAKILKSLLPKTIFAQSSVYIIQKKYYQAARLYEEASRAAQADEDQLSEMDAWRMAAVCYESEQELPKAWKCNQNAISVAEKMEPELVKSSTLPFVGEALLRLAEPMRLPQSKIVTRQKMIELIGPNWEDSLLTQTPVV